MEQRVLLSNAQVLEYIGTKLERPHKRRPRGLAHCDWIANKVHEYLSNSPCVQLDSDKREALQGRLRGNKKKVADNIDGGANGESLRTGYNLTETETIQILNFMPTEPVELHLMVEDIHDRFPDEKDQEGLLALIAEYRKDRAGDLENGHANDASLPMDAESEAALKQEDAMLDEEMHEEHCL
jgi:RNA polymerase Rpb4